MNTNGCTPARWTTVIAGRVVATFAAAALLGACQSSAAGQPGQESTRSPSMLLSPTPSATAASGLTPTSTDGRCATADLRVGVGDNANNDMQGAHVPLQFTNKSSTPCTLHGAPGVSYVTAEGGAQVGEPATRNTDGPEVVLNPGETASAGLFLSSAPLKTPDCERVEVPGLRVYPPGATEATFVEHTATSCEPPLVGPFLTVGPVEPGPDNTGL
jgi:hypothetical protein